MVPFIHHYEFMDPPSRKVSRDSFPEARGLHQAITCRENKKDQSGLHPFNPILALSAHSRPGESASNHYDAYFFVSLHILPDIQDELF